MLISGNTLPQPQISLKCLPGVWLRASGTWGPAFVRVGRVARLSRNISNKSGVIAQWKKWPFFHVHFPNIPTTGNPRFNTFCHRTLLLVFLPKDKKNNFVCECKWLLFPQFCLSYFPRQQQNHPFTHLCHAISHSPSSCPPPKTFPIHSRQHTE